LIGISRPVPGQNPNQPRGPGVQPLPPANRSYNQYIDVI